LQSHSGLDPLYTRVLQSALPSRHFTRVLQTIITITEPLSITDLSYILQIECGDVIHALQGVQSIIMVPEDNQQPVQLFHTSLRDFLTTQARSQGFFISPAASHLRIAADCLAAMTAHHSDIFYEIYALEYAANWGHHLYSAIKEGGGGVGLFAQNDTFTLNTLTDFVSEAFDQWINSIILQGLISNILETLYLVLEVSVMYHSFCNDLTNSLSVP
jgi:hypothetical protein